MRDAHRNVKSEIAAVAAAARETEKPHETEFHEVGGKPAKNPARLFLCGGGAGPFFEPFLAPLAALPFGPLSELLSHSAWGFIK